MRFFMELVMRIELMNLFITNEVLYRLSYTSTAHLLYLKIQWISILFRIFLNKFENKIKQFISKLSHMEF